MSREDRRRQERKGKKETDKKVDAIRWISNLPKEKAILVENYAKIVADKHNRYFTSALERSYSAAIIDYLDLEWSEVCNIINIFDELVTEDVEKMRALSHKHGGDLDMAAKKINEQEQKVRDKASELISQGKKQKEIMDILTAEFPILSKSMLTNAYKKVKTQLKVEMAQELKENIEKAKKIENKVKNIKNEDDVKEALDYIFNEEVKEEVKVETIVVPKLDINPPSQESDFEIISEVRVVDLRGKHGIYHVERNVVEVKDLELAFSNCAEVNMWANEERFCLEKQIEKLKKQVEEITLKEKETIKVIEKFI